MTKNQKFANEIIELVGGKANVVDVRHCLTRLRFDLKDHDLVKKDELSKTEGVLGVQESNGELHVVIGPNVAELYDDVVEAAGVTKSDAIDENLDEKKSFSIKNLLSNAMNSFIACITPSLPLFMVYGALNLILSLLGPSILNVLDTSSQTYAIIKIAADACTYFIPFALAYGASRKFKTTTTVSFIFAAVMLHPNFLALVTAGEAFKVFGIPMKLVNYSGTVFPIILIVYVQSLIEKLLNKYSPNAVKAILVPTLTVLIMLPLGLCVLGPIGQWCGEFLAKATQTVYNFFGPIETMVVSALHPILISTGMSKPLAQIAIPTLLAGNPEYTFLPTNAVGQWVYMGIALGVIVGTRKSEDRQIAITGLGAQALGGVSEPIIYGLLFKDKKYLVCSIVSGAVGGVIMGIFKVGVVALAGSGIFYPLSFVSENTNNLIFACIALGAALVVGFITSFVVSRKMSK